MNCTDDRIIAVCKELLYFLKSSSTEDTLHGKEIKKISRGNSCFADINLGFCNFRMIYSPLSSNGLGQFRGSDEGAKVILTLPFSESGPSNSQNLEITCYYSERGSNALLTAKVPDEYRSSGPKTRRVTREFHETQQDPLKIDSD